MPIPCRSHDSLGRCKLRFVTGWAARQEGIEHGTLRHLLGVLRHIVRLRPDARCERVRLTAAWDHGDTALYRKARRPKRLRSSLTSASALGSTLSSLTSCELVIPRH